MGQKPPQDFLHISLSLGFLDESRVTSGPLQRPFCGQGCVGDAGLIAQATAGEFDELGPYLGGGGKGKLRCKAQSAANVGKNFPVGSGFARGTAEGGAQGDTG